jgi:hypothetical protein
MRLLEALQNFCMKYNEAEKDPRAFLVRKLYTVTGHTELACDRCRPDLIRFVAFLPLRAQTCTAFKSDWGHVMGKKDSDWSCAPMRKEERWRSQERCGQWISSGDGGGAEIRVWRLGGTCCWWL